MRRCSDRPRSSWRHNIGVEVVILMGLPAAGKTTFYHRYFAATHRHVSKDLWPHARGKAGRQQRVLAGMLAAGDSVVVDNTNPTARERAEIVAVARTYGARIVGYYFDVATREAVARNAGRSGRARVPNVAIFTVAKRFELPAFREGFDQLFRVTIRPDRSLAVTELADR